MAQPPVEQSGDAAGGESQRMTPTPFLTKTYQLVEDSAINDVISWNEDGSSFVVWNPTAFARDLLPKYFKHNNFSSFVRQLNTYGFRKAVPDRWEFSNECFRKGEKRLLCEIQRRKVSTTVPAATVVAEPAVVVPTAIPTAKPVISPSDSGEGQVISSQSSPSVCGQNCAVEVMDENEKLRKENRLLSKELTQMKSLCNNIFSLMSNYSNGQPESGHRIRSHGDHSEKPLNLMPADNCCRGAVGEEEAVEGEDTRLFGVHLSLKRAREEGGPGMSEYDAVLQLQQPGAGCGEAKPEPRDQNNPENTWRNHNHCHGDDQTVSNE